MTAWKAGDAVELVLKRSTCFGEDLVVESGVVSKVTRHYVHVKSGTRTRKFHFDGHEMFHTGLMIREKRRETLS